MRQTGQRMSSSKELLPVRTPLLSRPAPQKSSVERKDKYTRPEPEKPYSRPSSSEKVRTDKLVKNNEVTEKLNGDLLDLVNTKVDFFVNNVKLLLNCTNKLTKYVYAKSPEVEQLLKTYKNQKTVVEDTIQNLVSLFCTS
jgi:hypothetical protein